MGLDDATAAAVTAAATAVTATALLGCSAFIAYAARLYARWRTRDQ